MFSTLFRLALAVIVTPLLGLTAFVTAGPASAAASAVESMPLWRVQVRVTTGDTASAGTTGKPAFRFNSTSTGVRTLNPPSTTAFGRSVVSTHDLRLFDTPSQLTMFRVGIAGTDDWCISKTELLFNGRVAFAQEAVPGSGGACVSIQGGTYLEYSSAAMRSNRAWIAFGTPPALPSAMSASTMLQMVTSVTGSAMLSSPGVIVRWDATSPLRIVRKTSTMLGVSYRVVISDPSGVESPFGVLITYDVRLYVGQDGNLHAVKSNASCCYHYSMSDHAVAQVDTALARMSARPALHAPLRFTIDSLANVIWTYST